MVERSVEIYLDAEKKLLDKYGIEAKSIYIDLKNPAVRTRVLEIGEGTPVLMVHGGGGISTQWLPLIPHLKGHRILAVDRPGHGLSGPFNYRGSDFSSHTTSFLGGVLDELDLNNVPVIANSMGGHWTLRLAMERPEKVSSMALLGCPALFMGTTAPLIMRLLGVRRLNSLMWSSQKPSVKMMKNLHKMMGHEIDQLEQHPDEYWQAVYLSGLLPGYKKAWLTLLERVVGPFGARKDVALGVEHVSQIQQPTMFIWGEDDGFGGSEIGEQAVEIMPNASLTAIKGGHLPWLDDPKLVGEYVQDWLVRNKV